jgi:hypothetical protein
MQPAAQKSWNEGIIDRPVQDLFVPPPMYTRRITKESSENELPETKKDSIMIEETVTSSSNFVFHGRQEYGKTTLINQIALALLERVASDHVLTLPILIDFADIKPGHDRIIRVLNAALPASLEGIGMRQLLGQRATLGARPKTQSTRFARHQSNTSGAA